MPPFFIYKSLKSVIGTPTISPFPIIRLFLSASIPVSPSSPATFPSSSQCISEILHSLPILFTSAPWHNPGPVTKQEPPSYQKPLLKNELLVSPSQYIYIYLFIIQYLYFFFSLLLDLFLISILTMSFPTSIIQWNCDCITGKYEGLKLLINKYQPEIIFVS